MPLLTRRRIIRKSRALLGPLIRIGGGHHALTALRNIPGVTVLAYHEVRAQPLAYLPPSLVTSTDRFAREMAWVKDHFEMISLEEAKRRLSMGVIRSHAVAVSFDDGFAGVRWEAYPILERLAIPATVFLNGGFYLGEEISPRLKAEHLLACCSLEELRQRCPTVRTRADVLGMVKDGSRESVQRLNRLFREVGGPRDPGLHLHEADLRAMSPALIHVGNHGWSHRRLAGCSEEEQAQEIVRSHETLSALPHFRALFAPPFGTPESIDATTRALADRFYDGWMIMLGGGINRPQRRAAMLMARNAVGNDKPPLLELLWLNVLGGGLSRNGTSR